MPSDLRTTDFLDVAFTDATMAEVVSVLDSLAQEQRCSLVVTPNVDHLVMLHNRSGDDVSSRFQVAYQAASLRLCDSRILQTLAWLRGVNLRVVTGSDLTAMLFEKGWLNGRKVALIGGDGAMGQEIRCRYPAIALSHHVPPMGVLSNEIAIAAIEDFLTAERFHYILFAIGAPQSEIIAQRVMAGGGVSGVTMCIGASIEFLLGRKVRAPKWVQLARLEWAFRLLNEPRRLWRRYLLTGPRILALVWHWQQP